MTEFVRAFRLAWRVNEVTAGQARDLGTPLRWRSPGEGILAWLHTLGRDARPLPRAEEGRVTKYPAQRR